jgi:hypothetical protein
VGNAQGTEESLAEEGLRVLQMGNPRRGVTGVPDSQMAPERTQDPLVEDLGNQAHPFVQIRHVAIAGGDAGALLAAMLQGAQRHHRQRGRRATFRTQPHDPTRLPGMIRLASGHRDPHRSLLQVP